MKRFALASPLLAVFALLACGPDASEPVALDDAVLVPTFDRGGVRGHAATNFRASGLSGDNEVPSNDSRGAGTAIFRLDKSGSTLHYKLIVANTEDVTQAHIHLAPAGQNGPVAAFLFGFVAGGVTQNGILAEGSLTQADLIGPLAGQPLGALVDAMRDGGAYVNVHTVAIPSGEVRAQIH